MRNTVVLLLAGLLLPGASKADTLPRYQLTVLPLTFYSLSGHGCGLNNKGQVIGDSTADRVERGNDLPPLLRLALWQRGKKLRLLFSAQTHLDMDRHSTAVSINDRGQVVGNFQIISSGGWTYYGSHAFCWTKGHLANIPLLPGDDYGAALGLNNHGDVVGTSNQNIRGDLLVDAPPGTNANAPHAFVYRRGKTTWLGFGSANSINDRGQIVGASAGGTAVLWQNGGRKTLWEGAASAINEAGMVVGTRGNRSFREKPSACLWKNGRLFILSSLRSDAYGVNRRGQVVGEVQRPRPGGGSETRASLWQRGREYDLNRCVHLPKGWILNKATGINDRGWIIGEGHVDSGPSGSSPEREFTFLLTPQASEGRTEARRARAASAAVTRGRRGIRRRSPGWRR